jgi:hypothetical protein
LGILAKSFLECKAEVVPQPEGTGYGKKDENARTGKIPSVDNGEVGKNTEVSL